LRRPIPHPCRACSSLHQVPPPVALEGLGRRSVFGLLLMA
jgi:hypothetical protein